MMAQTKSQFAVAFVVTAFASPAMADIPDSGLLNDVTEKFLTQSATWGTVITGYASWIFWVLATISMVWTFGLMALRKADIGEFFAEFIRFTVTTGFFWWLLSHGPDMAMAVINSLRKIGAEAGGLPSELSPSRPITIGFDIVKKAFVGLSWVHPIDNLGIVLVTAVIVIAMAAVAANILIALVTAWVMAFAGVFILGFGGSRWTSDMAIGYFRAMLGVGLELMTMTLLVAIAVSVIDGFYKALDGSSIYELLLVVCVCVVLALLIEKIPGRVAALVGGGSGASVSAATVMGAAAVAATAAATAGAAMAAGAASVAGGAQALTAAFSKALAAESGTSGGGMGALTSATSGASAASGPAANGGGDGSAFAAAMGDFESSSTGAFGGGASLGSKSASDTAKSTGGASSIGDGSAGSASSTRKQSKMAANNMASGKSSGAPGEVPPSQTMTATGALAAKAGKVAAGTAINLAQGSWDVLKAKASDIKGATMERIGETTGGKIASAIRARQAAAKLDEHLGRFGEDTLSQGQNSLDADAEVAAFRDRKSTTS